MQLQTKRLSHDKGYHAVNKNLGPNKAVKIEENKRLITETISITSETYSREHNKMILPFDPHLVKNQFS